MSYNLFLDDVRTPEKTFGYTHNQLYLIGWKVVRDYNDFVRIIEGKGIPEMISFDHDLAEEHYTTNMYNSESYNKMYDTFKSKTGYDCAKWLIDHCIDNGLKVPEMILIHSMNPSGSQNIESLFRTYAKIHGVEINIERYIRY